MKTTSMLRLITGIVLLVALAGCGEQTGLTAPRCQSVASSTAPTLTEVDSGRCINMAVGATAELRLAGSHRWTVPTASGNAVELVPIRFLRDPGYSAWEIRGTKSGNSKISTMGTCDGNACASPTVDFSLTIAVS